MFSKLQLRDLWLPTSEAFAWHLSLLVRPKTGLNFKSDDPLGKRVTRQAGRNCRSNLSPKVTSETFSKDSCSSENKSRGRADSSGKGHVHTDGVAGRAS